MKSFFIALAVFCSTAANAHQTHCCNSQTILATSKEAISNITNERIYIKAENLSFINGQWFLQNDAGVWNALEADIFKDHFGFYSLGEIKCPKNHPGFKKVDRTWYCLTDGCPYYYLDRD